ncbi:hypothetical protein AVEN_222981-1 [Araneus ventricosus]|uniref:Uncharacterized protein n=1 Tax=Araneus ventricosus TaxID=182803 RepID=A0A4Y2K9F8_ARAVE|nr:hypothetical protein AVEN_222981-1 [Araneus ventricosus]
MGDAYTKKYAQRINNIMCNVMQCSNGRVVPDKPGDPIQPKRCTLKANLEYVKNRLGQMPMRLCDVEAWSKGANLGLIFFIRPQFKVHSSFRVTSERVSDATKLN